MEPRVEPLGRPKWFVNPAVECQVHHLNKELTRLAVVTVHTDGRRMFEFDNELMYTAEEVEAVLRVGKELTA